jgi:hypothetical protein
MSKDDILYLYYVISMCRMEKLLKTRRNLFYCDWRKMCKDDKLYIFYIISMCRMEKLLKTRRNLFYCDWRKMCKDAKLYLFYIISMCRMEKLLKTRRNLFYCDWQKMFKDDKPEKLRNFHPISSSIKCNFHFYTLYLTFVWSLDAMQFCSAFCIFV